MRPYSLRESPQTLLVWFLWDLWPFFGHGPLYNLLIALLFRRLLPVILLSLLSLPVPVVLFDLPVPPSLSLVLSFAQSFERVRWFQRFQFL